MPIAAYLRVFSENPRLVGFGFVMTFCSSFGQTFFIGVFGPEIQAEFGLDHTAWGSIFMAGTLASAILLPFTGRQIDRIDLRVYAIVVCGLGVGACLFISKIGGVMSLVVAIFLLRHAGQGLASHLAITTMARYFEVGRGRAIAAATLGYAVGEAVLPFLAVLAIGWVGWRSTYTGAAALLGLVLAPIAIWLLRGHAIRHRDWLTALGRPVTTGTGRRRSWTRAEMLRDRRFYLLLPGLLAPAAIVTALFFHQLNIADAKGWSHGWITASYVIYAGATVVTALSCGPLIDRYGAVRTMPALMVPLVAGLMVLAYFDGRWAAWAYLGLIGLSSGISHTCIPAMWAEVYGVAHLGAIRSLGTALTVLGTALGPVAMGALLDRGIPIEEVCVALAAYSLAAGILLRVSLALPARDGRA